MRRLFILILSICLLPVSGSLLAGDGANARFLVPLYTLPERHAPGAHGSLWTVTSWFHYGGSEPVEIMPRTHVCIITCDQRREVVQPMTGPQSLRPAVLTASGFFLYVPAESAFQFTFGSRVHDVALGPAGGASLPVVPEHEFRPAVYLLNVPLSAGSRVALRIYALPETPNPEVTIRYFRMPPYEDDNAIPVTLLREDRVRLVSPAEEGSPPLLPAYRMVPNVHDLPELFGSESVWVQITAASEGVRIWAMASTTENDTQHVTVVSPEG